MEVVHDLVSTARARVSADQRQTPSNLLEAMVSANSDEASAFTDDEIAGNILIMFLAGEDTTANTLAWMMHLMAEHPEVQRQMQAEADRVLGCGRAAPTYESTADLRYVEAMAQETMRLLPVAPLQGAEPIEDTLIGDVWVPKGTPIYLLAGRAAKLAASFSEPLALRPDRWLNGGHHASEGHDPHAFFPFGGGPRVCPGRHLALLEIKVVAAMLGRNFEVVRPPGAPTGGSLFVHDDAGKTFAATPRAPARSQAALERFRPPARPHLRRSDLRSHCGQKGRRQQRGGYSRGCRRLSRTDSFEADIAHPDVGR